MRNSIPHFIAVGTSYAGLKQLMGLLAAHPVVSDKIPSLDFFGAAAYEKKGIAWYTEQLHRYQDARLVGECTPDYLSRPNACSQIVRDFPDAKLIVVVRNPIVRAIEQFQALRKTPAGSRYRSCVDFLTQHPQVQESGCYGRHLHQFFAYYSALDMHVIVYEDLIADPYKVTQSLYRFLGLDEYISAELLPYAPPPDEPKRRGLIGRTIRLPFTLFGLVKKKLHPPKKKDLFPVPIDVAAFLSADEQQQLYRLYKKDVALLSQLLHRDMAVYWGFDQFEK